MTNYTTNKLKYHPGRQIIDGARALNDFFTAVTQINGYNQHNLAGEMTSKYGLNENNAEKIRTVANRISEAKHLLGCLKRKHGITPQGLFKDNIDMYKETYGNEPQITDFSVKPFYDFLTGFSLPISFFNEILGEAQPVQFQEKGYWHPRDICFSYCRRSDIETVINEMINDPKCDTNESYDAETTFSNIKEHEIKHKFDFFINPDILIPEFSLLLFQRKERISEDLIFDFLKSDREARVKYYMGDMLMNLKPILEKYGKKEELKEIHDLPILVKSIEKKMTECELEFVSETIDKIYSGTIANTKLIDGVGKIMTPEFIVSMNESGVNNKTISYMLASCQLNELEVNMGNVKEFLRLRKTIA